jgi:hypothetical protein
MDLAAQITARCNWIAQNQNSRRAVNLSAISFALA